MLGAGAGRVKPTLFAVCAHTFSRINLYAQDHTALSFYRSLLQASTVALDTAWPWANDTYGLCCLRAYFCPHKTYTRKIALGIAMGFLLQPRMSWLHALSKGCRRWRWCCGPGCWWLSARLRRAAALVGRWCRRRCCQLATRTDAGVSAVEAPKAGGAGCVHSCSSPSHVNKSWDSA